MTLYRLSGTIIFSVGVMFCSTFLGCRTPAPVPFSPQEHSRPPTVMLLAPGDELDITFLGAPELNTKQRVRRDGRISLRILGDVVAAGKTPGELQQELVKLYAPQLQVKEVSVVVTSPAPIFVAGSVLRPGRYDMARPVTALEAIMEAGGFDPKTAEVRSVVVIRNENGRNRGFILNFKPILAGQAGCPFYLQPFDVVYVPRTLIPRVDQAVDQYINQVLPKIGLTVSSEGEFFYRF
ncbi:MAG: polysaccharide export protein, partial [Kiritimatiellae bacterium]|nr:polysaccharide export protein [Kiritimatiellia bacterium]